MVKISEVSLPPFSSSVVTISSCLEQRQKRARKSAEAAAEEEDDRISTLPDALILHILSLLTSTRDAIRTSVLSRRWLRLWTHVPNLFFLSSDIKSSNLSGYPQQDFAHFVNRALLSHSSFRIKKFLIKLCLYEFPSSQYSQINGWLHYAMIGEAKELTLDLSDSKNGVCFAFQASPYSLPQFFYSNCSLVELNIKLCDILPSGKIKWVNLKILRLKYSRLTDDVIENVLSGSPVLETLELSQCMGINHLNIMLPNLKRLVMNQMYSWGNIVENSHFFAILAPYVCNLEILGYWRQIRSIDVPSLISCNLDFQLSVIADERQGNIVKGLVEMVYHCKELKIGAWCLEALSKLKVEWVPSQPSESEVSVLYLPVFCEYYLAGIASLLYNLHKLEKLVIDISRITLCNFYKQSSDRYDCGDNYWELQSQKRDFSSLLSHLRTIEIFGFGACYNTSQEVLPLVEFLIRNGKVLQEVIIHDGAPPFRTENLWKMTEKLLSFLRCSRGAVILFHK